MQPASTPASPDAVAASPAHAPVAPSRSTASAATWLPILLSVAVAVGSLVGWVYERHSQSEKLRNEQVAAQAKENQRLTNEYLFKLHATLVSNKGLSDELNADYSEPGWGILESYVIRARRDGHGEHVLMYQRINRLVRQNAEILSLLGGYLPHAITPEFKTQAEAFTDHAQRYIDRWEVVPKVVETRQMLPMAKVFPPDFPAAVQGEIDARKARASTNP